MAKKKKQTPSRHLQGIAARKLWQQPGQVAQHFQRLFDLESESEALAFLQDANLSSLANADVKKNHQLNVPDVLDAYRTCAAGKEIVYSVASQKKRLAAAQALAKKEAYEAQQREEVHARLELARNGDFASIESLRNRFPAFLQWIAPPAEPLKTAPQEDSYLLDYLTAQFSYPPSLVKELKAHLLGLRKAKAASEKQARLAKKDVDKIKKQALLQQREYESSLVPAWQVPTRLKITKTEYLRWREEGLIAVEGYRMFTKWGKPQKYAVHLSEVLNCITPELLERWRKAHAVQVAETRKKAATQALKSRRKNSVLRKSLDGVFAEQVAEWQRVAPEAVPWLGLAYWTMYASRWAKAHHEKAWAVDGGSRLDQRGRHIGPSSAALRWLAKKEAWYELKDAALKLLEKSQNASISFYAPDGHAPIQEQRVTLCERHYHAWQDARLCFDFDTFVKVNKKNLHKCPDCEWRSIDHRYDSALYSIEIADAAIPGVSFSFHTPYRKGQDYLPSPHKLPDADHVESEEGLFRFGRAIAESELVTHSEVRVKKALSEWMEKAKAALAELPKAEA